MPELVPVDHDPFVGVGGMDPTSGMPGEVMARAPVLDPVARAVSALATLPKRALDASAQDVQHLGEDSYQPQSIAPAVETAMTMMGGSGAVPAEANSLRMGIKAYHGSPHDFDAFSLEKIGTGEGAQQEGHGLYLAENPETARFYKDKESAKRGVLGRMYEVDINAEPGDFIDRNAPFEQQPQKARDFIAKNNISLANDLYNPTGPYKGTDVQRAITNHLWEEFASKHPDVDPMRLSYKDGSDYVARRAAEEGIPGVKYLDLGSKETGEGTRNYVVFNDKLIDIVKKYAVAGIALPPAIAAAYGNQFASVDHNPFEARPGSPLAPNSPLAPDNGPLSQPTQ